MAPFAFSNLMIHRILQFTLRIAVRCVLHRCANQDIHRWKFEKPVVWKIWGRYISMSRDHFLNTQLEQQMKGKNQPSHPCSGRLMIYGLWSEKTSKHSGKLFCVRQKPNTEKRFHNPVFFAVLSTMPWGLFFVIGLDPPPFLETHDLKIQGFCPCPRNPAKSGRKSVRQEDARAYMHTRKNSFFLKQFSMPSTSHYRLPGFVDCQETVKVFSKA